MTDTYKIIIKLGDEHLCDEINIGLIFIDENKNYHAYISRSKFNIIKPFLSDRQYEMGKKLICLLENKKYGVDYLDMKTSIFRIEKFDFYVNRVDYMLENPIEIYEFLYKKYIFNNIRADKLMKIFEK